MFSEFKNNFNGNDFSGKCFFVLCASNFTIIPRCFNKRNLVPCCLQDFWICYDTKRFFSASSNAIESNCFVLPPSFCLPEKENFSRRFICELGFLRWFLPSLQDESRTLFNCCANQSKKMLLEISEPLLSSRIHGNTRV